MNFHRCACLTLWLGLLANPMANILLSTDFSAPDGPVIEAPDALWKHHSGPAGELRIAEGQLHLVQDQSEDVHATLNLPATNPSIRVETAQINTQHDAKRVTWFGPARFFAAAAQKQSARSHAMSQGVLQFDMELWQSPSGPVKLAIECGAPCRGELDFTAILKKTALHQKRTVKIPLLCFEDAGSDFLNMDIPFSVYAEQPFSAAFTQIQLVSGAAQDADALSCADLSGAAGP